MSASISVIFKPFSALFNLKRSHMRLTAPMSSIYFNTSDTNNLLSNAVEDNHARLYVVGNGAPMASKCVMLKQAKTRVLFNCGESADFKGIPDSIYITHISWDKMGGIPSVIYKASSSMRERLSLCGPPGLDYFIRASESFLWLHQKFKLNIMYPKSLPHSEGDNFSVTCVPVRSRNKIVYNPPPVNKSLLKNFNVSSQPYKGNSGLIQLSSKDFDFNTSNSYICKSEGCKTWLFEECAKRGVKPGEQMLKLWEGESITADDGSVVQPKDVIRYNLCPTLIIIDCPTKDFLDDFISKDDFEVYYKKQVVIVHFTPVAVMHDARYITWMQRFMKDTKHLIVNDSNEWESSPKVLNKQKICRTIHPRFFPELRQPTNQIKDSSTSDSLEKYTSFNGIVAVEAVPSEQWLQKWSAELKEFSLVQSQSGTNVNLTTMEVARYFQPFEISCLPDERKHADCQKTTPKFSPKNPRITFLGTGSQASSTYRNAPGIFLQMSSDSSILMDCGDGTMKQFATLFDDKNLVKVLSSLRCIYISHTHADHHAGVIGVLLAIQKAWKSLGREPKNLVCLLPAPIMGWLQHYHNNIEPILENVILVNLLDLMKENVAPSRELNKFFLKHFGMKQIRVCWAIHSTFSYCVTFEHATGWQISYSGDTRFNQYFVDMGRNSDLLIHEATYGAGLNKMAQIAKHSTTDEAIRVGKEMRAKHVILTHFSRRYPIIPCLRDLKDTKNVAVAMDFLQVTLSDLHLLPKLHEDYEVVFDMYEQENINRNAALKKRHI